MTEKIGAGHPEFLLGEIPRQLRERGREDQRQDRGLGLVGVQSAALDTMRDEVVGITPTPGRLRPGAPRDLTRRGRTGALATTDPPVRHKPATADAAGTLREHPQMLASSTGTQGGPLLASDPGSILASAEAESRIACIGPAEEEIFCRQLGTGPIRRLQQLNKVTGYV
jgi:hypothetical protein